MSRFNRLLWSKPSGIKSYGVAVLSAAAALVISRWLHQHFGAPPGTMFICAVMLSAWYGGVGPGLLATALSTFCFHYFFLPPVYSLGLRPGEIPKLAMYMTANLIVGLLSAAQRNAKESVRRTRDDLTETVKDLQRTNDALLTQSREREQAENRLRRSEAYLAEAQRLTKTGSWAYDPATEKALYWSDEMFRIHGLDPQQGPPTSKAFLEHVHPDDRDGVREAMPRAVREKTEYEVDHRMILPDGAIAHIQAHGHPVLDRSGDVVEVVGSAVDVTERKRAEETLRQSETYLREAQQLSHTGSWAWNIETQRIFWSSETFKIFGIDPETTTPTPEIFMERIHPEDRAYISGVEAELYKGNRAEYNYRIMLPDGSIKYVTSIARPISNVSGQVIDFVGTVMDVTERKRAEEERERLRQVQADLAHLSRVATMGELTASLAHEIKQPIAAAVTNANTCMRWLGREQPNVIEAGAAAARIIKDVTRASEIISRLGLLFKKGTQQREAVDVNDLIREMIVLLRNEANRYSIGIRTELTEIRPVVIADRVQLQQVFMNLMLNGIEAMKEADDRGELTIRSEDCDGQLLISVSDTGVGLPQEQADQIFKAFFTTKDKGTGMGLPISRSIIESHGGRLWVASNSGRGATFQFTLPTTAAAHA